MKSRKETKNLNGPAVFTFLPPTSDYFTMFTSTTEASQQRNAAPYCTWHVLSRVLTIRMGLTGLFWWSTVTESPPNRCIAGTCLSTAVQLYCIIQNPDNQVSNRKTTSTKRSPSLVWTKTAAETLNETMSQQRFKLQHKKLTTLSTDEDYQRSLTKVENFSLIILILLLLKKKMKKWNMEGTSEY